MGRMTDPVQRILNRVDGELHEDQCWNCSLSNDHKGYSLVYVNKRTLKSHRVMWEVFNGCPIPDGMVIRHKCDNPSCVNPNHLTIGTHKDNQNDKKERGRGCRGDKNVHNKLTEDSVREIKTRLGQGEKPVEISKDYGVSFSTIYQIRNGTSWGWV